MADNIVRTVYGAILQTAQLFDQPVTLDEHSTLNEKLGILPESSLSLPSVPSLNLVLIGNKGHTIFTGSDGFVVPDLVPHDPTDAAPYGLMPFVLRLPSEDLSAEERANYRLRRLETRGTTTYVAYYGRVIDTSGSVVSASLKTVTNGETNSVAFKPTLENLSPVPKTTSSTGVNITSTQYISATAKVPFTMSTKDIEEYQNVVNIIYQDSRYSIISEVCICTSIDTTTTGDFNGVTSSYTEAIGVQVMTHVSELYPLQSLNSTMNVIFDVGAVEPINSSVISG